MKHLIIFVIIILGILLIKCSVVEKFTQVFDSKYKLPDATIKYSYQIESNGVFANNKINKGDLIEVCPALIEKTKNIQYTDKLKDYYFEYDIDNSLIGLGYCSMYNHKDDPNANWEVLNENQMEIKVVKTIHKGEEIFISYGSEYFNQRKHIMQNK
jgi:SET domain-containing protein